MNIAWWHRFSAPTGQNDHVEPAGVLLDNLVPYLLGADFTVIPSTGHLIPLEAPADLADAITAFAPAT
jgi:pimeloyl-ACP methyl ester carboxylesterase